MTEYGIGLMTSAIWIGPTQCNNVNPSRLSKPNEQMLTRPAPSRISLGLFAITAVIPVAFAPAAAGDFGPPPGAELSIAKLAPIQGFVDGEIKAGRIPGAIV